MDKQMLDSRLTWRECRVFVSYSKGTHDLKSFGSAKSRSNKPITTIHTISQISVTPGHPLLDPLHDPLYQHLKFWDINITANGFLYKQDGETENKPCRPT
ncbi:hypothetical protein Pmani_003784 [Petrolisthes manimaculis]|uniref:Uncharacterized protein n=1 Tax=Petrolisthes manimaculis TaxID=1843537 RepID=A0AAE1QFY8_9EUCA|nr:hypothetical protein Pmani_003784 [Petrolisthes manimaculis]